jgi:hypothetical protein
VLTIRAIPPRANVRATHLLLHRYIHGDGSRVGGCHSTEDRTRATPPRRAGMGPARGPWTGKCVSKLGARKAARGHHRTWCARAQGGPSTVPNPRGAECGRCARSGEVLTRCVLRCTSSRGSVGSRCERSAAYTGPALTKVCGAAVAAGARDHPFPRPRLTQRASRKSVRRGPREARVQLSHTARWRHREALIRADGTAPPLHGPLVEPVQSARR